MFAMDRPDPPGARPAVAPVIAARHAMATRFEIVLHGGNPTALRAAAEEALDEIQRLENVLSMYRPGTDIARVNALAHGQAVRVSPEVFRLLQWAERLHRETDGAFDITIGPLVHCWRQAAKTGRAPSASELAQARSRVGMSRVHLDPERRTVRFDREGMMLDLGAMGKGYAIEQAAALLRDLGVTRALIHGGTSSVFGMEPPPGAPAWNVTVELPREGEADGPSNRPSARRVPRAERPEAGPAWPMVIPLRNESLSVSAVWGRSFCVGGRTYGHVLDPRTGAPLERAALAAVVWASATESDAFSTALLVLGAEGLPRLAAARPGLEAWWASGDGEAVRLERVGGPAGGDDSQNPR